MKLLQQAASKTWDRSAFTLSEIMVTIGIMSILFAIAFGGGQSLISQANKYVDDRAMADFPSAAERAIRIINREVWDGQYDDDDGIGGVLTDYGAQPDSEDDPTYYIFSSAFNYGNEEEPKDKIIQALGWTASNPDFGWVIICTVDGVVSPPLAARSRTGGNYTASLLDTGGNRRQTASVHETLTHPNAETVKDTYESNSSNLSNFCDAVRNSVTPADGSGSGDNTPTDTPTPESTPTASSTPTPPPSVTCEVIDDQIDSPSADELAVTLTATLSNITLSDTDTVTFTVIVRGSESDATLQREIPCGKRTGGSGIASADCYYQYVTSDAWEDSNTGNIESCWNDTDTTDTMMTMRVVLDANTTGAERAAFDFTKNGSDTDINTNNVALDISPLVSTSKWTQTGGLFKPGEELQVAASAKVKKVVDSENTVDYQSRLSNTVNVNPLYYPRTAHTVPDGQENDGITYDLTISNARQLRNLALDASTNTNIKYAVKLNADIELADTNPFTPISNPRVMTFDGGDKSIKNLVTTTDGDSAGLFGDFAGTEIKNTRLYADSTANVTGNTYAGGIVGHATNENGLTISNSFAALTIKADNSYGIAGGLVGKADGKLTVENSYADCYIQGISIGGLAGECGAGSLFDKSYSAGFPILPSGTNTSIAAGITTGLIRDNSTHKVKETVPVTIQNCWSLFFFEDGNKIAAFILPFAAGYESGNVQPTITNSYYTYGAYKDVPLTFTLDGERAISQMTVSARGASRYQCRDIADNDYIKTLTGVDLERHGDFSAPLSIGSRTTGYVFETTVDSTTTRALIVGGTITTNNQITGYESTYGPMRRNDSTVELLSATGVLNVGNLTSVVSDLQINQVRFAEAVTAEQSFTIDGVNIDNTNLTIQNNSDSSGNS